VAGLVIQDVAEVEVFRLELRNFCVGIAVLRSNRVFLHDLKITDSFTTGVRFTAGTYDSVLQDTTIGLTRSAERATAVGIAGGGARDDAVMGNTISGYVNTAVTVAGAGHTIRDNRFVGNDGLSLRASGARLLIFGNTFSNNGADGLSVSGAGSRVLDNVVTGNRGRGVVVGTAGVTLSRNAIYGNTKEGLAAATSPVPVLPRPPELDATSAWNAEGVVVRGSVSGTPGERYAIEIFLGTAPGDAQVYLGTASATPAASGSAPFMLTVGIPELLSEAATGSVTATARDAHGSTSVFSGSVRLTRTQAGGR